MKIFTNKNLTQKILIVLLIVILVSFSIPKPVHAVGGIILGPLTDLVSFLLDTIQHLLEWAMLGDTAGFTFSSSETSRYNSTEEGSSYTIEVPNNTIGNGLVFNHDPEIVKITYTPEEIFSNRIPMLDVNFINPSVLTGNTQTDNDRNVAIILKPIISGWYVAIRILAIVGLLSVLVYLGIRMLLSSVAADRAKYKKMLADWIIGMCLVFALHYIMSFALTMAEVLTSFIASSDGAGPIFVKVTGRGGFQFRANLMSYVRFMVQSDDDGITFLILYLMLIIFNIRFTWVYLKRVVNMAFLTIIAPFVALTYPIDKVSDGSAQAFNMWVKEYAYNALIQPIHLLLYMILLGSAIPLATRNPIYAIVALGFILSAEKLVKQMFGFNKATGGTLGTLAGAAGVTALASKALTGGAQKMMHKGGNGGNGGKIRTKDNYQRSGKNPGANKDFQGFDYAGNKGKNTLDSVNQEDIRMQALDSTNQEGTEVQSLDEPRLSIDEQLAQEKAGMSVQDYRESGMSPAEWEENRRNELEAERAKNEEIENNSQAEPVGNEQTIEALRRLGPEDGPIFRNAEPIEAEPEKPETFGSLFAADMQAWKDRRYDRSVARHQMFQNLKDKDYRKDLISGTKGKLSETKRKAGVGAYKTIKGIAHAAPTAVYKAARGTLKLGARAGLAATMGTLGLAIGATTGDGEQALSMMGAAAGAGFALGDNAFDGTAGRILKDNRTLRESYGAARYGSAQDYRNKKADDAYIKSQEHKDLYEQYFKSGDYRMTKAQYDKAVRSYRESGITDNGTITKALKLETKYKQDHGKHGSDEQIRKKVQNIAQSYDNVDKKAVYGDEKATKAALNNIETQLKLQDPKQKRAVANEIMQGYRDWYNA